MELHWKKLFVSNISIKKILSNNTERLTFILNRYSFFSFDTLTKEVKFEIKGVNAQTRKNKSIKKHSEWVLICFDFAVQKRINHFGKRETSKINRQLTWKCFFVFCTRLIIFFVPWSVKGCSGLLRKKRCLNRMDGFNLRQSDIKMIKPKLNQAKW